MDVGGGGGGIEGVVVAAEAFEELDHGGVKTEIEDAVEQALDLSHVTRTRHDHGVHPGGIAGMRLPRQTPHPANQRAYVGEQCVGHWG